MRKCLVLNCNNKYRRNGYCDKHSAQIKKCGKILEITSYNHNEIIIKQYYAEIILRDRYCNEVGRVIIDLDDVQKVRKYKWCLAQGYCIGSNGRDVKKIRLHRYLLNAEKGEEVDHKNRNKLDNRKINLRIVSSSINGYNKFLSKYNKSGVCGVGWYKRQNKWYAQIKKDGKMIHLGYFNDKKEAIKVRKKAELKYFGEEK